MQRRQCEVIGCPESAVWARTVQTENSLEDFLCNACWLRLAAKQPEQAACYVLCSADFITHHTPPICSCIVPPPAGDAIVIQ
jgi:hypothetical protein